MAPNRDDDGWIEARMDNWVTVQRRRERKKNGEETTTCIQQEGARCDFWKVRSGRIATINGSFLRQG
jgi:hypothetical protein